MLLKAATLCFAAGFASGKTLLLEYSFISTECEDQFTFGEGECVEFPVKVNEETVYAKLRCSQELEADGADELGFVFSDKNCSVAYPVSTPFCFKSVCQEEDPCFSARTTACRLSRSPGATAAAAYKACFGTPRTAQPAAEGEFGGGAGTVTAAQQVFGSEFGIRAGTETAAQPTAEGEFGSFAGTAKATRQSAGSEFGIRAGTETAAQPAAEGEFGRCVGTVTAAQQSAGSEFETRGCTEAAAWPTAEGEFGRCVGTETAAQPAHEGESGIFAGTETAAQPDGEGESGSCSGTETAAQTAAEGESGSCCGTAVAAQPVHEGESGTCCGNETAAQTAAEGESGIFAGTETAAQPDGDDGESGIFAGTETAAQPDGDGGSRSCSGTAPAAQTADEGETGCFAGTEAAAQPAGERVPMWMLSAGDLVLTAHTAGGLAVTRVVVNQHAARPKSAELLTLHHAGGSIDVTADHVVHLNGRFDAARLVAAGMTLSGPHAEALTIQRVTRSHAAIVNPITASGTILAAGPSGGPVLAATGNEWLAGVMLSWYPQYTLSHNLARVLPQSAQAYYDAILEPFFSAAVPSLRAAKIAAPAPLLGLALVLGDLLLSVGLCIFMLSAPQVLLLASAAWIAREARRRTTSRRTTAAGCGLRIRSNSASGD